MKPFGNVGLHSFFPHKPMVSQEVASAPRKITLGWIAGWILGIILIVPAISLLMKQPVPGVSLLAASLVLLPPVIAYIQKKGHFQLSSGVKFILIVVFLGIAAGTMDTSQSPARENAPQAADTNPTNQAQATAKSYQEIFVFSGNGAKKSEPFIIEGDRFKIAYDCKGDFCQAWLKKPDSSFGFDLIMNSSQSIKDESIFYKSGTYYIESNSLGSYTMSVQDYR